MQTHERRHQPSLWRYAFLLVLSSIFICPVAEAVLVDEAFVIDWQRSQIGRPMVKSTFLSQRDLLNLTETRIVTFTEAGILGALEAQTGNISWRHQFPELSYALSNCRAQPVGNDYVTLTLSGQGVTKVSLWDIASGYNVWESQLEAETLDLAVSQGDIFLVTDTGDVYELDSSTGFVNKQIASKGPLKSASLTSNSETNTVFVTYTTDSGAIFTYIAGSTDAAVKIADSGAKYIDVIGFESLIAIVWETSTGQLQVSTLSSESDKVKTFSVADQPKFSSISVTGTQTGHIVITFSESEAPSSWAVAYSVSSGKQIYGVDRSNPQFVQYGFGNSVLRASSKHIQVFDASTGSPTSTFAPFAESLVSESVFDWVHSTKFGDKVLSLVVTKGSDLIFLQDGEPIWQRDESLANIIFADFLDLEKQESTLSKDEFVFAETSDFVSAYIHRWIRHLGQLHLVPTYIYSGLLRIVSGKPETIIDSTSRTADLFGFRKFLIALTGRGKVLALDTGNFGQTVWSVSGLTESPVGLYISQKDHRVIVASRHGRIQILNGLNGGLNDSRLLSLDQDETVERLISIPTGNDDAIVSAWTSKDRLVAVENSASNTEANEPVYLSRKSRSGQELEGFQADSSENKLIPTWRIGAETATSKIFDLAQRDSRDHTVSIGRVLGDRSVLYKYLNPVIAAFASVDEERESATVSLINLVTGQILYSEFYNDNVDVDKGVKLVVGEHWVVFTFWSCGKEESDVRGDKIVVWDLYDSAEKNKHWFDDYFRRNHTESAQRAKQQYRKHISAFDPIPAPFVESRAFALPYSILDLAVSVTKFGVTSRDIIVWLESNQITVLPKFLLDGRRPYNKPTQQEMEEGLFKYEPILSLDASFIISHSREVLPWLKFHSQNRRILTETTYLESTSIVVALGVDVFGTRITPSKPFDVLSSSFNKPMLLATIVALIVGLLFTKPLVAKRDLNVRWDFTK